MKTNTQTESDEIQEPGDEGEEGKQEKPEIAADDETGGVVVREHIRKPANRRERREQHQSDEAARLRQENEDLRRQFDAHRQQTDLTLQQLRQGTQQIQQGTDPHKVRMESIRAEQELIQTQVRASQDAAEVERLRKRFYALNDEADELRETRILTRAEERAARIAAQAAQSGQGEEAILRAEFPEVIPAAGTRPSQDQMKVLRYAAGEYQRLTAKGEPETIATSRKAMQIAAEEFGFRRAQMPAPSLAQQQRFGSLPIQAGQQTTRNETRLNKQQMSMAISRWPNVPEEQAYANMARALADLERREKAGFGDEIS